MLAFKEKKQEEPETGISSVLEQSPLASWVPVLKRLKSTVAKGIDDFRKPLSQLPLAQPHLELSDIHSLLSNEKARLLHIIKTKKPASIYKLAKLSGREFKAVRQDLRVFEKFGLIKLVKEKTKAREKLKPVLQVDKLNISISI